MILRTSIQKAFSQYLCTAHKLAPLRLINRQSVARPTIRCLSMPSGKGAEELRSKPIGQCSKYDSSDFLTSLSHTWYLAKLCLVFRENLQAQQRRCGCCGQFIHSIQLILQVMTGTRRWSPRKNYQLFWSPCPHGPWTLKASKFPGPLWLRTSWQLWPSSRKWERSLRRQTTTLTST